MDTQKLECAVCGAQLDKVLLTITMPDRFEKFVGIEEAGYKRQWIECPVCGLAVDVRPYESAELKKLETGYYEVDFKGSSIAEKYKKVMSLPPEKSDNTQRVKRIGSFLGEWFGRQNENIAQRRVLDIGGGTGVFLSRFLEDEKNYGREWEAVAVEPDPLAAGHMKSLNLFEVVQEAFPCKAKIGQFSLCTLNKIVEHITEPVPFLKSLKGAISEQDGVLYIEVPDKLTIDHRPATDNILGALHHHLYSPGSLAHLLEKSGYEVLEIKWLFEPSGKISVVGFATISSAVKHLVA